MVATFIKARLCRGLVDDDAGSIACLCLNDYNFKSNIEYMYLKTERMNF